MTPFSGVLRVVVLNNDLLNHLGECVGSDHISDRLVNDLSVGEAVKGAVLHFIDGNLIKILKRRYILIIPVRR